MPLRVGVPRMSGDWWREGTAMVRSGSGVVRVTCEGLVQEQVGSNEEGF